MVKASYVTYGQFKDAVRLLDNWAAAVGSAVPALVLYSSMPGSFTVTAVWPECGVLAAFDALDLPESFAADYPAAIEAHAVFGR